MRGIEFVLPTSSGVVGATAGADGAKAGSEEEEEGGVFGGGGGSVGLAAAGSNEGGGDGGGGEDGCGEDKAGLFAGTPCWPSSPVDPRLPNIDIV